jgi:FKBP-type peptidyl-prolyl cis-trans isomerase (trigger factor)
MISALNRLEDGTLELTITIPWKMVTEAYQESLKNLAEKATIKGFRKGKAPLKIVEEKLGKQEIYEEVLKDILPKVYLEAIKEHDLRPVVNPKITVISLEDKKDWQVKATTCELPKIELGDYKEAVKKTLSSEKIWVPGKDKEPAKEDENQRLEKIFQTLLENIKIKLPAILLEEEVNRMLSRLIDQTARLGLTVEQYLSSAGKTTETIKKEYQGQAEQTLKLELILSEIANQEKVEVKEEEINKMIEAIPDQELKKSFDNQEQRAYVKQLLRKRQVIDNLSKL